MSEPCKRCGESFLCERHAKPNTDNFCFACGRDDRWPLQLLQRIEHIKNLAEIFKGHYNAERDEVARLNADVAFLAPRAFKDGQWYADEDRDFGLSANNLVNVAYGYKDSGARPYDKWDMRAAERAYAKLPVHRMTEPVRVMLCEFRAALNARP